MFGSMTEMTLGFKELLILLANWVFSLVLVPRPSRLSVRCPTTPPLGRDKSGPYALAIASLGLIRQRISCYRRE